jgi:putative adenylate-forming enzyme
MMKSAHLWKKEIHQRQKESLPVFDRLGRFLLVYRLHRSFYNWDPEKLLNHQKQQLDWLMRELSVISPYYHRLQKRGWNGQFDNLPYLSKMEMIDHFDEINTAGLKKDDLFKFAIEQERGLQSGLYRGKYSVGLSSGTSGTRLPTVLSANERRQYGSLLFARSGIPEHVRKPQVLFLLRVNNPAFTEVRFLGVKLIYSDYTHPPETLVNLINENQLNVLAGPPSMLRLLARLRDQLRVRIEALISYAEVLDDATRTQLCRDFDAPLSQIYQGAEGFIASTCRKGNLHLNEDVMYVETLDAGDTISNARRVVVTDLFRTTLPFIRYQLNDVLEIGNSSCACGSCFRVVERIHGRADDVFYLHGKDGQMRYLFPDYVVRSINQASEDILEFQAIQHSPAKMEIRLQVKPEADHTAVEKQIRSNLSYWTDKLNGELGEIIFSDAAPERNPNSHKLIRVVRNYQWTS